MLPNCRDTFFSSSGGGAGKSSGLGLPDELNGDLAWKMAGSLDELRGAGEAAG